MTRFKDFMKRLGANLFRWLVAWGVSAAGFVACVDVRRLAQQDQDDTPDQGCPSLPPPDESERLTARVLTPAEQELWRYLEQDLGSDCGG
jgi:hypothetical protein